MKKTIILKLIILILMLSSCEELKYREAIIDSYKSNATENNIALKISNVDILKKYKVGDGYFQQLIIEDLNSVISDSHKVISLLKENISIYNKFIKEKTASDSAAYYTIKMDSFKIERL